MVVHDPATGALQVTDLGRIAAKYYIRNASIEIFNNEFKPRMSEADVLAMLSQSKEVRLRFIQRKIPKLKTEGPSLIKSNFASPK
jgi:antiviral helicase SLH1